MEDTCTCPKCYMENAYYDGVVFVCPDCDFEWSNDSKNLSFKTYEEYSEYEELTQLKVPFFKLEHGKLYDCKVKHKEGIDDDSIIPLAFLKGKNQQYVMTNARELFKENPGYVEDIIKMDFDYIYNDGIRADYPFDYEALTNICATQVDGTLVDFSDCIIFDLILTDVI